MEKVMKRVGIVALVAVMLTCGIMSVGTTGADAAAKPAKPKLSLKKDGRKITISWKKCKNAKKYEVWELVKGKSWVRKKTTTSLKYSKTVSYDKQYYYRVRGLNGKTKGSYSSKKSVKIKKPAPIPKPEYRVGGTYDIPMPNGAKVENVKITVADANQYNTYYEGKKDGQPFVMKVEKGKIIQMTYGDYCKDGDNHYPNGRDEDGTQHAWTFGKNASGYAWCFGAGAWEEGIKIYYTYDGTEPKVGQEDKKGDETGFYLPQYAPKVKVRGTVSYGDGLTLIGDYDCSWFANYGNNKWTIWAKAYKNDQCIGEWYVYHPAC